MAHTGIFATEDECIFKMGMGYDAANVTEERINELCAQAESFINVLCRYNFSENYDALSNDVKRILSETASNLVGIYGAQYSSEGYGSQREQENIININWARFVQCISLLKDQNAVTYIKEGK